MGDTRIIDQDIQAPVPIDDGLDHGFDLIVGRNVSDDRTGLDTAGDTVSPASVNIRNHHLRPFLGEPAHDAFAKAGPAAGYQGYFIF